MLVIGAQEIARILICTYKTPFYDTLTEKGVLLNVQTNTLTRGDCREHSSHFLSYPRMLSVGGKPYAAAL